MKKSILFLLPLIIFTNKIFSQTNYQIGFSDGYKAGYCYNIGVGCIPPIVPITPLRQIGESSDSYFDGYNRGLLMGSNASIKNKNDQIVQKDNSLAVYAQPQYIPKIERFTPNYTFYENVLKQNQQDYNQQVQVGTTDEKTEINKKIEELGKDSNDPEKKQQRKQYIKFLKLSYTEFKVYPKTIPDGIYKVTRITGGEELDQRFIEGCEVIVKDNRIIKEKCPDFFEPNEFDYAFDLKEYPPSGFKDDESYMIFTTSYPINNGKGEYKLGVYYKSSGKTLALETLSTIYFMDYIVQYQNAQDCINEIHKKYSLITKYPKVQDGWNIVQANNGTDFCDIRKVFVENAKITLYKDGADIDHSITTGGNIINGKTTLSYIATWKDGSHPTTIFSEIYFH